VTSQEEGHVLVFLTGQEEIEKACELIRRGVRDMLQNEPELGEVLVLSLYASLSAQHQQKAFKPPPRNTRKVVVATNIAETSVTVPGIRLTIGG
jgi:HrpA-like RNA helicase